MKKIGIYNPYLETRGGGEKVCLALAKSLADMGNHVTLIGHSPIKLESLGRYLDIDLSKVHADVVPIGRVAARAGRLPVPQGIKNLFYDLSTYGAFKKKRYDVFINNCIDSNLPNPSKKGVYICMFPQKLSDRAADSLLKEMYRRLLRLMYRLFFKTNGRHAVYTYDLVVANSLYTQGYIKKYWDRESDILYPICDNMQLKNPPAKEKVIVSVGRFFENTKHNHHKRHDFMIETFKKMTDLHKKGWELHLVGSVAEDTGGLRYILSLIQSAQGYPVYFHFNAPRKEVIDLYNRARIYWHATGYGFNAHKHPAKQEHFGISTVEAMSAGCVPVVIDSAGQRESVSPQENGFLWKTPDDLITLTTKVANMSDSERTKLATNARETAKRYDAHAFTRSVRDIFSQVTS